MRAFRLCLIAPALFALACGAPPSDSCAAILEENAACVGDSAAEACAAAEDECPGQVVVRESCPIQFSCP